MAPSKLRIYQDTGLRKVSSVRTILWISSCLAVLLVLNRHVSILLHASNMPVETTLHSVSVSRRKTTTSYAAECETNPIVLVDSRGRDCVDFEFAASKQGIHAVDTPEVSYVYCAIPKNGCTYHLGLMQRLLGFEYRSGGHVHTKSSKSRLDLSGQELRNIMSKGNIPKYFVVRNPLERVLSAYLDKVERFLPTEEKTPKSFESWAYAELYPGMEGDSKINPHWLPQVSFCGFEMKGLWKQFRWFRVEDPVEYVDFLEETLPGWVLKDGWNGKKNVSFREAVLGPRQRTGHTSERFFHYVRTVALFDHLVSCYENDIDRLGYEDDVSEMRQQLLRRVSKSEIQNGYDGESEAHDGEGHDD